MRFLYAFVCVRESDILLPTFAFAFVSVSVSVSVSVVVAFPWSESLSKRE